MYVVRGRSAALAAAGGAIFDVWNPHATQRIRVLEIRVLRVGTTGVGFVLRRATARGTPGSTVTPDVDHHNEQAIAPASGFLLDLAAFSAQPTLDASELYGWEVSGEASSALSITFPGRGLAVPPGTGIAAVNLFGLFAGSEITVAVGED